MFDNPFLVLNSTAVVDFFYKLETQSSSASWLAKHCRDESVSKFIKQPVVINY